MDSDPSRLIKKDIIPESTKSQIKSPEKLPETIDTAIAPEEATPAEEPKKPRYFPPRRLPNPFESAAQEQERFI
jgi:hypothetical protein